MQLRPYQQEASDAFLGALRHGCNPVVALPTGSGKSLVIAHLARHIATRGGRLVVLAHVQELLSQNYEEYVRYTERDDAGIYSAGLGLTDVAPVTFAGIQSVYRKPELFKDVDLIIVDEAHTVPPDGEGLMYSSFLSALPQARRGGVTATPWRLDGGVIYGEERYFDVLAYTKSPLDLVEEGYLSPLRGVSTSWQLDLSGVQKTGGDYNMGSVEDKMSEEWVKATVEHAVKQLRGRKHVLIFCPTIAMATSVAKVFSAHGLECGTVSSQTEDRESVLASWQSGLMRGCANVDILTTGFNFPSLDAIVNLRPTQSSALWVQMLGRGMRKAMGKADCIVLDYAGNLERLGGVATMETWHKQKSDGKLEEQTEEKKEKKGEKRAGNLMKATLTSLDPMLESKAGLRVRVLGVNYAVTRSKIPGKNHLLASYECETEDGVSLPISQFCCVEYTGGARFHAEQWFKRRGGVAPRTATLARVEAYSLKKPKQLVLRKNEGYINVEREIF